MTKQQHPPELFDDPERAARNLVAIHEMFIHSGSHFAVDVFSPVLDSHLQGSPDPDMALNNLLRFGEATLSKASLFNDLLHYPVLMEVLMKLFGFSQYFADILVRDPGLFRWLTASDMLNEGPTKEYLAREVHRVMQTFGRPERRLDALKRLYRREVLRIGSRDILGYAELISVTRELSDLADVLIEASCQIAAVQLAEKYGLPAPAPDPTAAHKNKDGAPRTPFVVIGLGKLGGGELNYSSDIDILFVYGGEGEFEGGDGRAVSYHEYFNKFAEKLVQNLSEKSLEGHLYRVDMRLRPEGRIAPLARSLQSCVSYYESRGELWERQMLIKARPVAGDTAFGDEFLRQLVPFVYPRTFFQHPAESIVRIKARIETAVEGEENIKLGAGGIRDVEFTVQALQLLNGGKMTKIREGNTLRAIETLAGQRLLSDKESKALTEGYVFFRNLEHRLQIMQNIQTHTIPKERKTQDSIAKRMGLTSEKELRARSESHRKTVREIFSDVLLEKSESAGEGISAVLDGNVREEALTGALSRYGFHETRQAGKNLMFLLSGSSLTRKPELDTRSREAFRLIAQQLFQEMSATPSPDMTLRNLTILVSAQKLPDQFYSELNDARFRKLILSVCAVGPRFVKGLSRNPLLLESIASDPHALAGPRLVSPLPAESIHDLKNQEELRAGIRNVLGLTTFNELTGELSQLADIIVTAVFSNACVERKTEKPPLAVFALGKYGTRELTFDADLDILFVVDSSTNDIREQLENTASATLSSLSEVSEKGRLYDIDARLRPEGKSAPLIIDKPAYAKYLRERASLWERQSLTRARFVCGDESLANAVVNDVESFVYEEPLPASWVDTIVTMRRGMETHSRTRGSQFLDIKRGAGGMVDVEFLAQMVQLRFGREHNALRHGNTVDILTFKGLPCLSTAEADSLAADYRFYRQIEKLLRITLEERTSILPDDEKMDLLARCLDGTTGDALVSRLGTTMKGVRSLFLDVSNRIAKA